MKVLIWFSTLFVYGVLGTLIAMGINASSSPSYAAGYATNQQAAAAGTPVALLTVILIAATFFTARTLCKHWDRRVCEKEAAAAGLTHIQYLRRHVSAAVLSEAKKLNKNQDELKRYLRSCIKNYTLDKKYYIAIAYEFDTPSKE